MYLKRLDIYGFKTFAQRTTFEFLPGVTAVVGPNGSGKSNVADAVRWVLGEQSFANLRSKRTDDLIFGGGKGRAPMGFAEVFLTIDNSDRLLPLPYDEVTIGRRAYRNGENEYTINRARVRLRDVADAVAPLGSSYTIINQGLVDTALALQPEERRRLFEDAAEIGPYQARKHEAERRLRETETNLLRLNDLVSELEPQLRTLKRQARDAEAVGAVEQELRDLLIVFYAAQWRDVIARLQAATEAETRLAEQLGRSRSEREQVAALLQTDRERLRDQRGVVEQRRAELDALERSRERVARDLAVATERIVGLRQRQAELEGRRSQLEAVQAAAEAQATERQQAVDDLLTTLEAEQAELARAESALQQVIAERRVAESALQAQREALIRAAAAIDGERDREREIERRRAAQDAEERDLGAAIERAEGDLERRAEAMRAAVAAVADRETQLAEITASIDRVRGEIERARGERAALDDRITAAKRRQGELQARFDALNRLARSYEGAFAGVRAAMQWAEREGRSGFALVSSLLRVGAELETAIEVALGSRLQQIVVERWEDAEAAIAQLKRSNAGRATFLPLDTLRINRRSQPPTLDGIRGVAADLIEVDPRYGSVAAYLLGRTLIAEDLQVARRAVPQLDGGWTIVTLGGEQIATGGAVTGGAATRESGTLRRERELRDLPRQLEAARADVETQERDRKTRSERIDALLGELRNAEAAQHTARAARDEAQHGAEARRREQHRAEDEVAALHRRAAALGNERTALATQAERVAESLVAAQAAHSSAQAAADATNEALSQHSTAVGDDEAALRELRDRVARIDADVRSQRVEIRSQQQLAARACDELRSLDRQTRQFALDLDDATTIVTDRKREVGTLDADIRSRRADLDQQQQVLRGGEQAVESLEARDRDLTAAVLDGEARHGVAAVELERRRSERDLLWERAIEDNIDVEGIGDHDIQDSELEPRTVDHESEAASAEPRNLSSDPSRIEQLRGRLRRMGPVNALAPEEYRAAQERYTFLVEQLADVRSAAHSLREAIGQLDQVMQQHFEETFDAVAQHFSRMFTRLFGGGTAKLLLQRGEGEQNGTSGGIEIVAQPPGKRTLNLQLLSGGERALTAAALLFAILTVNPSPFCILDEVDAALDEANVVRFREALLDLAEQTQFILVTHNRGTVEAANTLYGITMGEDSGSRVLSLRLEEVGEDGSLVLGSTA